MIQIISLNVINLSFKENWFFTKNELVAPINFNHTFQKCIL